MNIEITDATDDQIREFASTICGIDPEVIAPATTRAKLLAVLSTVWTQEHISVPDPARDAQGEIVTPTPVEVYDTSRDDGPPTTFKILQTDMPGGKHPAAPDVNGRKLVIQRNILVKAPYAFYLALNDAKVAIPHQAPGVPGLPPPDVEFTEVTNYPLSEVVLPPAADIAAWHARNGPRLLGGEAPTRLAA